jgi:hypothetical protein
LDYSDTMNREKQARIHTPASWSQHQYQTFLERTALFQAAALERTPFLPVGAGFCYADKSSPMSEAAAKAGFNQTCYSPGEGSCAVQLLGSLP